MTHRIAVLKPDYHYVGTDVPFDKSVAAIMALLRQHKCERIGLLYETVNDIEAATLVFQKAGLPYKIEFPLTYIQKRTEDRLLDEAIKEMVHKGEWSGKWGQ